MNDSYMTFGFCEVCLAEVGWTEEEGVYECINCGLEQDFVPDTHITEREF